MKSECDQLLEYTSEEYKKLCDALKALLRGEGTGEEFKAMYDSTFKRTNKMFDDYFASKGIQRHNCASKVS